MAAGFEDVRVVRQDLNIDVPAPSEFVPLHLGAMPIAGAFHALPDSARAALVRQVETALQDYVHAGRMTYPDAVNVVTGVRT